MAAETLSQVEDIPSSYSTTPEGLLSAEAEALDASALWARLERWIAYRWTARAVVWIVEGPGQWSPSLTPVTLSSAKVWRNDAWETVTPSPSPLGGYLLESGTYQIIGTAGDDGEPPAEIWESFRRLAEYLAAGDDTPPGASRYGVTMGTGLSEQISRDPRWIARALELSGAADLLRPFRRA